MTIVGFSHGALAMICDALYDKRFENEYFLFNNLGLDERFFYPGFHIKEVTEFREDTAYILGAVMPATKKKIYESFSDLRYVGVKHPSAVISNNVSGKTGSIIDAHVTVSSGCEIGRFVTIYSNSTIAHDCSIKDFVTICPNVAVCGNVNIGEGSFIGAGSVIKNGVTIGKNCVIGCGSVVIRDVQDSQTVCGNPAKELIKI